MCRRHGGAVVTLEVDPARRERGQPAVHGGLEPETQRVVVGDDGIDRCRQNAGIDAVGELEHHRLVEVVETRRAVLEEPELRREQRGGAGHRTLLGDDLGGPPYVRRELADGLVLEQLLGLERESGAASPGDDLDALDRVAAQLEEVVVDADGIDADDCRPDVTQRRFDLVAGCDELLRDGRAIGVVPR